MLLNVNITDITDESGYIEALKEYLSFQFCFQGKTLFDEVAELQPGHYLTCKNGSVAVQRYWQVYYQLDFDHTEKYFSENYNLLLFIKKIC